MKAIALSWDKKRYLVHIYITQGYTAAAPLAIQYGISPKTISKYALAAGHKGKCGREPGVWKNAVAQGRIPYRTPSKQRAIKPKPSDPRWQKAIERGGVVA